MRPRQPVVSPPYPKVRFAFTDHPITVWAGAILLRLYFELIGLRTALAPWLMPFTKASNNQIPDVDVLLPWWYGLALGAARFEHMTRYCRDPLLPRLLGLPRFPFPDTLRRFFQGFTYRRTTEISKALMQLSLGAMRPILLGHTLDLDSTLFCRYGMRDGRLKRHNAIRHGRPVHHPMIAWLSERRRLLWANLTGRACGNGQRGAGIFGASTHHAAAGTPDQLGASGRRIFCDSLVCTGEVTDDVATALVETIQKLDRGSKQHYHSSPPARCRRVRMRRALLGQITDGALYHPVKTVRHVIFPMVCLPESAAERGAQRPRGCRLWQEVLYRKFVRHYRRMLPIILEHLSFRRDERNRPVMEALASIQRTIHSQARHFADPVPIKRVVPRNWQDRVIEDHQGVKGKITITAL